MARPRGWRRAGGSEVVREDVAVLGVEEVLRGRLRDGRIHAADAAVRQADQDRPAAAGHVVGVIEGAAVLVRDAGLEADDTGGVDGAVVVVVILVGAVDRGPGVIAGGRAAGDALAE